MAKQQRAIETRSQIINAAAQVFAASGYVSTSLNEIVRVADVTQGALYFHFGSKSELAAEVIRLQHAKSIGAGARHLDEQDSGIAGMVLLSGALANQILNDPVVRAGLRLSTEAVAEMAEAAQLPYEEWASTAKRFLEKARALGETRADLDLDAAAEVVSSLFTGPQFVSVATTGGSDLLERLARMWKVVLPGMVSDPEHWAILRASELIETTALEAA